MSRKTKAVWLTSLFVPALLFFLSGCQSQQALLGDTEKTEETVVERQSSAQVQADSSLPPGCRWKTETSGHLSAYCPDPTPPNSPP